VVTDGETRHPEFLAIIEPSSAGGDKGVDVILI